MKEKERKKERTVTCPLISKVMASREMLLLAKINPFKTIVFAKAVTLDSVAVPLSVMDVPLSWSASAEYKMM
jgi:hypothetical protein